jgi:uncharacterized LabA/DUF88 family protein
MKTNLTILWDIENVTPSNGSLFIEGLIDYAKQLGNISSALAIGNWTTKITNSLAVNLSENGFELIHLPQPDEKEKRKKNSSDFVLITKATEMIFQYPHIRTYIIITGDVDFRPLLQILKKHGKRIIIICDSSNASERLLEYADSYMDYRNLLSDPEEDPTEEATNGAKNISSSEAFPLLCEAVKLMLDKKQIPTPGSVKVRMLLLNENFSGAVEGFKTWSEFIQEAGRKNIIKIDSTERGIRLSNFEKTSTKESTPKIIQLLLEAINELSPEKNWIHFSHVSQALLNKKINIKSYKYGKFKELVIDAEKRNLVKIKNDNLKWYVKKV